MRRKIRRLRREVAQLCEERNILGKATALFYEQEPAHRSASYLRVVPNWVAQLKASVERAQRRVSMVYGLPSCAPNAVSRSRACATLGRRSGSAFAHNAMNR